MVPLLRQYNTLTCDNITKIAQASQTSCYLGRGCYGGEDNQEQPGSSSSNESEEKSEEQDSGNSICNLPSADFFQVLYLFVLLVAASQRSVEHLEIFAFVSQLSEKAASCC
jgi:hypothetical protein